MIEAGGNPEGCAQDRLAEDGTEVKITAVKARLAMAEDRIGGILRRRFRRRELNYF